MREYGPRPEDIGPKDKEPTKPKGPTNEFKARGKPSWETKQEPKSPTSTPPPWKRDKKPHTPPPFPRPEVARETPEQAQARLERGRKALEGAKTAFAELNHQAETLMAEIESLKKRKVLALPWQVKGLKAKVEDLVGTKPETKYHNLAYLVKENSEILHTEDRGEFTQLIEEIQTKYRSLRKKMNTDLEEIEKGSAINQVARWLRKDS
jgi:molecular chaperone GrpE (heat shock protein)